MRNASFDGKTKISKPEVTVVNVVISDRKTKILKPEVALLSVTSLPVEFHSKRFSPG